MTGHYLDQQADMDREDARYRLNRLVAALEHVAGLEEDVARLTTELRRATRRLKEAKLAARILSVAERRKAREGL